MHTQLQNTLAAPIRAGAPIAERQLLGRIAAEVKVARLAKHYDALRLLADELEAVAMHSDDRSIQARARRLLDTAFDPIDA